MMMLGYRSNDAVITICQNNSTKSIVISDVNAIAQDALGYKSDALVGKPLRQLLPARIAEMMDEYVEYGENANDIGQVLSKVQSFSVLTKSGKDAAYRLKVVRAESSGDTVFFKLVLQDKMGIRKNEAIRKVIQENLKGHEALDSATGLPDRMSLVKDIELMGLYSNKGDMQSCFAVLQIDHYEELLGQYGQATMQAMLKHIGHICRQGLRPDDVVGVIDTRRLGIILMDTNMETARLAANRLRWQIASNPFHLPDRTTISLSGSISFGQIGGKIIVRDLLDSCMATLDNLGAGAVNALVEAQEKLPALASNS